MAFILQDQEAKPAASQRAAATLAAHVNQAPMHQVRQAIENALQQGILMHQSLENVCHNCGLYVEADEQICPGCNQDMEDGVALDEDPDALYLDEEDFVSWDDTDEWPEDQQVMEPAIPPWEYPDLTESLMTYLKSRGLNAQEAATLIQTIKESWRDEKERCGDLQTAEDISGFGVSESLSRIGISREELEQFFAQWFQDHSMEVPLPSIQPMLEIRKTSHGFIPLVHDLSEDVVLAPGARRASIQLGGIKLGASKFLSLLRHRNLTLRRMLEVIIEKRREFLNAESLADAYEALERTPFEQKDVEEVLGCHKSTVSRHFRADTVLTPQGVFPIKALVRRRSRSSETLTGSDLKRKIRETIEKDEKQEHPRFLSDRQISEILKGSDISKSGRQVANLRESMGIPNSRERKKGRLQYCGGIPSSSKNSEIGGE